MGKICEYCGKQNDGWKGDAFFLTDEKILCHECAEMIREDINNLYYVKSNEEYINLKNQIMEKCKVNFNETITEHIERIAEEIYSNLAWKQENIRQTNPKVETYSIGSSIKTLASIIMWIGIVSYVIIGIKMMAEDEDLAFMGFMVMIIGPFMSWASSLLIRGFGQLVENSDILVQKINRKDL